MNNILKYFPELTDNQRSQLEQLYDLYFDWNAKINVISRKDIENLYLHHVLHSMSIAKLIVFKKKSRLLDVGTGGGFPGIPLAILFPECEFTLIDSIGKKIKVAQEVSLAIGLKNITFKHQRAQEEKGQYDFVISRAVMPLADLVALIRKNIRSIQVNAIPNGLLCLKGGELEHEILPFKKIAEKFEISDFYQEDFFKTKKIVYVPL
jgi:16S rRNA (guanine527-N7)-methyltransferase